MAKDAEIDRALAAISAALNDRGLDEYDAGRVQEIVAESLGGAEALRVHDGGGAHDESGARVGVIRRTSSGEWIGDRQNDAVERSDATVPAVSRKSAVRKLLSRVQTRL
jgi:hypothetical protein